MQAQWEGGVKAGQTGSNTIILNVFGHETSFNVETENEHPKSKE